MKTRYGIVSALTRLELLLGVSKEVIAVHTTLTTSHVLKPLLEDFGFAVQLEESPFGDYFVDLLIFLPENKSILEIKQWIERTKHDTLSRH